ncbi:MAG: hypothetical protein ABSF26_08020 [Thermoguttaceae bacterium]|jgi:hypothetical protein
MPGDALDVGLLEDTDISDADRRLWNTVRGNRVSNAVMLEFEKFGHLSKT